MGLQVHIVDKTTFLSLKAWTSYTYTKLFILGISIY